MTEKLTNITDPKYRCSIGACPAVYKVSDTEAAVKLSADLVLSSLGVAELVEAAEKAWAAWAEGAEYLDKEMYALREALSRMKGGK